MIHMSIYIYDLLSIAKAQNGVSPSSGKASGIERAIQSREIPQIKVLLGLRVYGDG